jgi:hypothetical protein
MSAEPARWDLLVRVLLGQPLPPLPAIPGRVHRCLGGVQVDDDDADEGAEPAGKGSGSGTACSSRVMLGRANYLFDGFYKGVAG